MKKTKVKVFKKGVHVGWYKDIEPGMNAIIATCLQHGYNIEDYEFRDFEDEKKVVWKGTDHKDRV